MAHRLALDHSDKVERMCLLDIAPTLYMYENTNMMFVSLLSVQPPLLKADRYRRRGIGIGSTLYNLLLVR